MELKALLQLHREDILKLAEQYGAQNVRVFGSVARGEAGPDSDIDLLVTLEEQRSLLDLVAFWQDLQDLLRCEVDVVTEGSLKERMRERILREAITL